MALFYVGSAGSEFTGMRLAHCETPLVEGLEDHEIIDFWVTEVRTFAEKAFLTQCTKLWVHEDGGGGVGLEVRIGIMVMLLLGGEIPREKPRKEIHNLDFLLFVYQRCLSSPIPI